MRSGVTEFGRERNGRFELRSDDKETFVFVQVVGAECDPEWAFVHHFDRVAECDRQRLPSR
jgi:hypothetical protein